VAKWGQFDFSAFENISKTFQKALDERVIERFIRDFLLEMAMRSVGKIKRHMKDRKIVDTGLLRRNWKVGRVERRGNSYQVEIFNPTEYAAYVEFGHRTGKDLTKWVEGRYMMTISMQQIERELPAYLEKRVERLLSDIMNGRPPRKG
jgi:hypothetical protein